MYSQEIQEEQLKFGWMTTSIFITMQYHLLETYLTESMLNLKCCFLIIKKRNYFISFKLMHETLMNQFILVFKIDWI